jgi:hypothetical protein
VLLAKYYYGDKIQENEMGSTYGTHEEDKRIVLVERSDGKRSFGRPRCGW